MRRHLWWIGEELSFDFSTAICTDTNARLDAFAVDEKSRAWTHFFVILDVIFQMLRQNSIVGIWSVWIDTDAVVIFSHCIPSR